MTAASGQAIEIPPFPFRIDPSEAESYRLALGVSGNRPLLAMTLRALTTKQVVSALEEFAQGRYPIHVGQDCRAEQSLRAGVDYMCHVRVVLTGGNRLRIEQRLSDEAGHSCLTLASDIALMGA